MYKAQLSFEFMVYLSIAGLSLLSSLSMLHIFSSDLQNAISRYALSNFVSKVNLASLSGIPSNLTSPALNALCSAKVVGDTLVTTYGNFTLEGKVILKNTTFCTSNLSKLKIEISPNQTLITG